MTERPLWTGLDELEFQMGDMNGIAFSEKKGIKGKHDSGHHHGRRSSIRREQESLSQLREVVQELPKVKPPTQVK